MFTISVFSASLNNTDITCSLSMYSQPDLMIQILHVHYSARKSMRTCEHCVNLGNQGNLRKICLFVQKCKLRLFLPKHSDR